MWPPQAAHYEVAYQIMGKLDMAGPFMPLATVYLPAVIWHDPAHDANEGWRAMVNGYECDVLLLWPDQCGRQISQLTYQQMIEDGSK
jgi:hypothetical protein